MPMPCSSSATAASSPTTASRRTWVEASVHPWVEDMDPDKGEEDPGYGYQWWVLDDGKDGDAAR